jgi:hypothetical protein
MAGLRFLIGLAVLAACSANQTPNEERADNASRPDSAVKLASSVEVEVGANDVRLVFHVTNPSDRPVVLEFSSGQRYDFAVRNADGAEVWRWSAARSFAQSLGTETIPPGGSLDYHAVWESGDVVGSYTAIAQLTALNHPVEQRTEFERRRR